MADPGMRAGFIRAICAAPADDLPRLVFADWLEENDEPKRSEYIRLRCAVSNAAGLCRLPPKAASGRARKVRAPQAWCRCQVCRQVRRAADLFSSYGRQWARKEGFIIPFKKWTRELLRRKPDSFSYDWTFGGITWRRGFVSRIELPLGAFLEHGPTIAAHHPVTTWLLTDRKPIKVVSKE